MWNLEYQIEQNEEQEKQALDISNFGDKSERLPQMQKSGMIRTKKNLSL